MPRTPSLPICVCGHDRHHDRVQPILKRGPWRGLLAVLLDAEIPPREIRFVCAGCETEVERSGDGETLRQYGRWPRVDREALRERAANSWQANPPAIRERV